MATKTNRPPKAETAEAPAQDGIDRAKAMKAKGWRNCPVTDLDATDDLYRKLRLAKVETIGQLADKLLYGGLNTLTVTDRNDLEDQIEQCSADDEKPLEFARVDEAREPDAIACPACSCIAGAVDGGNYGCTAEGCGWLGNLKDAEAFRESASQRATEAPTAAEADKPIEPAKTAKPEPMTPEELDEYDRETNRFVVEAESKVGTAESEYENLKKEASDAKKVFDARQDDLRKLIRDRADNRGRRPQATLLDAIPKWREKDIEELPMMNRDCESGIELSDLAVKIQEAGISTLGELYDQVGPQHDQATGPAFGLPAETITAIRAAIEKLIDAEAGHKAPPASAVPELWREFPIERWAKFGLTEKDIDKLHSGEAKGGGGHPIVTVGDLNRFVTPNPKNPSYARGHADIKGIGTAGADRISEAETAFWAWWKASGEAEFAKERGVGVAPEEAQPELPGLDAQAAEATNEPEAA